MLRTYKEVDPFPKATLTNEELDAVPEAISGFSVSLSQVWDESKLPPLPLQTPLSLNR